MDLTNDASAEQLITELLATGTMNDDSVADLNAYLASSRAGTLEPDDLDYLRAFHARIMGTPIAEPELSETAQPAATVTLAKALARAEWAEGEVVRLTALLAARDA